MCIRDSLCDLPEEGLVDDGGQAVFQRPGGQEVCQLVPYKGEPVLGGPPPAGSREAKYGALVLQSFARGWKTRQ
eukprot:2645815-Prorocentrum_lima.AAC.1